MAFIRHFIAAETKGLINTLNEAIVKFRPEAATEAGIAEIDAKFDELNFAFSKAKDKYFKKELPEYEAMKALYDQRMAAAELLQQNPEKEDALNKLVTLIEGMLPEIDREKREAEEAKQDMDQLGEVVTMYAEKLKTARQTLEKAKEAMERAEVKKERAQEMAEAAEMAAGLTKATSGLSTALDHMNKLAEQANAEADASERKAQLLRPTKVEDDADIKAAMDAVSGKASSALSIKDRLAALQTAAA